jgi:hypothetical protein
VMVGACDISYTGRIGRKITVWDHSGQKQETLSKK